MAVQTYERPRTTHAATPVAANHPGPAPSGEVHHRVRSVAETLRYTYGTLAIVAGLDKFTEILTDWTQYLAPVVTDIVPLGAQSFMYLVGVIEIIAGVLVLARPRIGSLVVGVWLLGIVVNLLLTGEYYDIAVRDAVIAMGAFSLYRLLGARTDR